MMNVILVTLEYPHGQHHWNQNYYIFSYTVWTPPPPLHTQNAPQSASRKSESSNLKSLLPATQATQLSQETQGLSC